MNSERSARGLYGTPSDLTPSTSDTLCMVPPKTTFSATTVICEKKTDFRKK